MTNATHICQIGELLELNGIKLPLSFLSTMWVLIVTEILKSLILFSPISPGLKLFPLFHLVPLIYLFTLVYLIPPSTPTSYSTPTSSTLTVVPLWSVFPSVRRQKQEWFWRRQEKEGSQRSVVLLAAGTELSLYWHFWGREVRRKDSEWKLN